FFYFDNPVEARTTKRSHSQKHSRSTTTRISRRSFASSKKRAHGHHVQQASSHSGRAHRSSGRAPHVVHTSHHGPTASQIKRQETSGANDLEKRGDMERAYLIYDQGITDWLSGNYSQAAKQISNSYEIYSGFHGSRDVLDPIFLFDLGQTAEAAGDLTMAKNSYQRCLRRRPDFSDACVRLSSILTRNGETALALVYARRLVDKKPQDPRAQFLLATILDRAGFSDEAKIARDNYARILQGNQAIKTVPATPKETEKATEVETPEPKETGVSGESSGSGKGSDSPKQNSPDDNSAEEVKDK
ncbi:MAG: hypothetical protein IAF58_06655, partial [Leptolyngbya sp.]|nr:hypothetical protein [Candidatus Melainabacteria bacterium]